MAAPAKPTPGEIGKGMKVVSDSLHQLNPETLKAANLAAYLWHYGTVTGLGFFEIAGGREVVILWDEGGASRAQGGISDQQWEIFRLAFEGSGRIGVLSERQGIDWKFDYRYLEALRQ
jgi:hypothetical protein